MALPLEVILIQWLYKFLIQDIFRIYHLAPLVHLGRMMLNVPWNFICRRIIWQWILLWGTCLALKISPNYILVCGWLHYHPKETMMPPAQFWLDGWRACLNFAMDFADDFVFDDPLTFYYFLEGDFSVNIFRFGIHYWLFWFHRVWCDQFFLQSFSPSLVCLNLSGTVRIVYLGYVEDCLEFSLLVESLFLCMVSDQICHACWSCFYTWIEFSMPVSVFLLSWIPCRFFSFFCVILILCSGRRKVWTIVY